MDLFSLHATLFYSSSYWNIGKKCWRLFYLRKTSIDLKIKSLKNNQVCYLFIRAYNNYSNIIMNFLLLCSNISTFYNLTGPTPFQRVIFYLWTDLNEICTAYVKSNSILFMIFFFFLYFDIVFEKIWNFRFFS